MVRLYNRAMIRHRRGYYEDSGFFNFGYWGGAATSQRVASLALVDRLIGKIATRGGRVLDVACGVGASTRRLRQSYAPGMITAINISEEQIAEARKLVPDCTFLVMDAARLEFPDNHFDAVICVEAAFHFNTREAFLREALRVLKPGGSLVLSDILNRRLAAPLVTLYYVPRANLMSDIGTYRKQLEAIGFAAVEIEDATDPCLRCFRKQLAGWPARQRRAGRTRLGKYVVHALVHRAIAGYFFATCRHYVLAAARKPALPVVRRDIPNLARI